MRIRVLQRRSYRIRSGALRETERRRGDIRVVFDAVGEVDAAIAVAAFREVTPTWCRPVILPRGSGIEAVAMAHPLLHRPTPNDVTILPGHGMVITGSNMSGKTTLLRALGVNVVLAQTIHSCIATRFACPALVVRSAISLTDSLSQGRSYYLAEATAVLDMLQADDTLSISSCWTRSSAEPTRSNGYRLVWQ